MVPRTPRDARRVIGVVVDDSRMTFESIYRTRMGLRRFVDAELQPDDLVTVVTTSGERGTSWPFTFSRPELRAAVNRLRFSLSRASAAGALEPLENAFERLPTSFERHREEQFAVNALNRIAEVIAAVRELPGRKTVLLVSEGFSMSGLNDWQIRDAMYTLVDHANRAGVVIYCVDPRGLVFTGFSAADGRKFRDVRELKQLLLANEKQLARNLAKHLTVYATGASIRFADREPIEQILERTSSSHYGVRSLIHELVQSELFCSK